MVFHQFPLDFRVNAPFAVRFECSQIRKHELRPFLRAELLVITGNVSGTMAGFVVHVVIKFWAYHPHIEAHFSGVIRGDKHLGFFFFFG